MLAWTGVSSWELTREGPSWRVADPDTRPYVWGPPPSRLNSSGWGEGTQRLCAFSCPGDPSYDRCVEQRHATCGSNRLWGRSRRRGRGARSVDPFGEIEDLVGEPEQPLFSSFLVLDSSLLDILARLGVTRRGPREADQG